MDIDFGTIKQTVGDLYLKNYMLTIQIEQLKEEIALLKEKQTKPMLSNEAAEIAVQAKAIIDNTN